MLLWLPVKRRESEVKVCLEKLLKRNDAIRNIDSDKYEALIKTTAGDVETTTMLREVVRVCVCKLHDAEDAIFWIGNADFNQYVRNAGSRPSDTAMARLTELETHLKTYMVKKLHVPL